MKLKCDPDIGKTGSITCTGIQVLGDVFSSASETLKHKILASSPSTFERNANTVLHHRSPTNLITYRGKESGGLRVCAEKWRRLAHDILRQRPMGRGFGSRKTMRILGLWCMNKYIVYILLAFKYLALCLVFKDIRSIRTTSDICNSKLCLIRETLPIFDEFHMREFCFFFG